MFKYFYRKVRDRYLNSKIDAYVLSYPKSGRTWLRIMMGKAVAEHYGLNDLQKVEAVANTCRELGLVSMRFHHDCSAIEAMKSWRDIKFPRWRYRNKRVVLLVRDIHDTLVSSYYHIRHRTDRFSGDIHAFVRLDEVGARKYVEVHNRWRELPELASDFLLIRYEDLHARPGETLRQVLDFLGLAEVSDDAIARACEFSEFENMRKMEKQNSWRGDRYKAIDVDNADSFKVRKGRVGGYVDELSGDDITYIDQVVRQHTRHPFGKLPRRRKSAR